MSTDIIETKGDYPPEFVGDQKLEEFDATTDHVYSCWVVIERGDLGHIAWVESLPGVMSQGKDAAEVYERIKDALIAALSVYIDDGQPIPWEEPADTDECNYVQRKRLTVQVPGNGPVNG